MSDAALRRTADRINGGATDAAWAVSMGAGTVHGGYNPTTRDLTVVMDSDGGSLQLPIAVSGYVPVDGDRVLVAGPVGAPHIIALIDRGQDVGIKLADAAVAVMNPTNTERRDLLVRDLECDGSVSCDGLTSGPTGATVAGLSVGDGGIFNDGQMVTDGLRVEPSGAYAAGLTVGNGGMINQGATTLNGQTNAKAIFCDGLSSMPTGVYGSGLQAGAGGITSQGQTLTNGLRVEPTGAYIAGLTVGGGGIVNYGGYTGAGPSEKRLKRDITARSEMLHAVAHAPVFSFRYREDAFPDVDAETWRTGPMVDDLPSDCVMSTEFGDAPEMGALMSYVWGAVGELAAKVDAQAEQITALTARLDALEAS